VELFELLDVFPVQGPALGAEQEGCEDDSTIDFHLCFQGYTMIQDTQPFNGLWSGTTRVGRYQKKHSPTHTHPDQTSFVNFLHLQLSIVSSLFSLRARLSSLTTSLQVLLVLDPLLHTPCISSPNHHLLFAAHAHTNAACSAAIPMLCHLYLVSLSAPNSTLSTTTFTRYNTAEANKDSNKTNRHQISGIPSLQFCWRPTIFARSTSAYFYWTEASQ